MNIEVFREIYKIEKCYNKIVRFIFLMTYLYFKNHK